MSWFTPPSKPSTTTNNPPPQPPVCVVRQVVLPAIAATVASVASHAIIGGDVTGKS